jgi:SNF2 family DNA or RNA helicase
MIIQIGDKKVVISDVQILVTARNRALYDAGKKFYMWGYVKKVSYRSYENSFYGTVLGERMYEVKVVFMKRGDFSSCSCNCDDYRSTSACKHTIAVMFAILKFFEGNRQIIIENIFKFENLDINNKSAIIPQKTIPVSPQKTIPVSPQKTINQVVANSIQQVQIADELKKKETNSLPDTKVSAPAVKTLALNQDARSFLTAYMDMLRQQNVKASSAIASFENMEEAKLVPTFVITQHWNQVEPGLELQIGGDRLYTVKDISDFVRSYIDARPYEFGKKFTYIPDKTVLERRSSSLMELITKIFIDEKRLYINQYSSSTIFREKKQMKLSESAMKAFFDIYENATFHVRIGNSEIINDVAVVEDNIIPQVELMAIEGGVSLKSALKGSVYVLDSKGEYIYYMTQIHKTRLDAGSGIVPLLKYYKNNKIELEFPENEAVTLFSSIVPALEKCCSVKIEKKLEEKFFREELVTTIYLDRIQEKGSSIIFAYVEFVYGEQKINPCINDAVKTNEIDGRILIRAEKEEGTIVGLLEAAGFRKSSDKFILGDEDKIYEFVTDELKELKEKANLFYSEAFKEMRVYPLKNIRAGVKLNEGGNMLELTLDMEGVDTEELKYLLQSFRMKKKYYRLKNGSFIPLGSGEINTMAKLLEELNITDSDLSKKVINLPAYRAMYIDNALKESNNLQIERNMRFKQLVQNIREPQDMEFSIPLELQGILRDYQKTGFKWLKTLALYGFGGILADDMGLGKTLQVITLILSDKLEKVNSGTYRPSIVVAPTSLVYNWLEEVRKFTNKLSVAVVSGNPSDRIRQLQESNNADLIITTYGMIKRDVEYYKDMEFSYCILDEAQHIKNPGTLNAKTVKMLKASCYFALTGTPIENSLTELWSIFDYIMPGYLLSQRMFSKRFETPIIKNKDTKVLKELGRHINPFLLRRMKRDVLLELPEKTESKQICEMAEEQKKVYLAYILKARQELNKEIASKGIEKSQIKIFSMLTRLRQICCHPGLFIENYKGQSAKLEMLFEILDDSLEGKHRILLFSQFTGMLAVIKQELNKRGIRYFYLDGATDAEERMKMVKAFNGGENSIFLISLKAGGTGLNLTGADVVIHYDPWWNPAVEDQATDRAYRIGQRNPVQVLKLITKGTIEEKIYQLQQKKKELINSVIQPGESFLAKMSEQEIKSLFEYEDL